jgi:lipoate-protein ligase A
MKKTNVIVYSEQNNPWYNLAVEEYLMDFTSDALKNGIEYHILYLWQNKDTVVIGRNQNAWGECRTGLLEEEGGRLARRSTGGGAVFHDMGNLNFSFITPKSAYDTKRSSQVIVKAVKSLGIDAVLSGRNDILVEDKKFSGNAFCIHRDAGLHHGTLLIESDYARIARYLEVSQAKLEAKGIKSVKSRVTNLSAIIPDITLDSVKKALEKSFTEEYPADETRRYEDTNWIPREDIQKWVEKHESWAWRYGQTLSFTAKIETRFEWGGIEIQFLVKEGMIQDARIYTDALDLAFFEQIGACLVNIRFSSDEIGRAIHLIDEDQAAFGASRARMKEDLSQFILQHKL